MHYNLFTLNNDITKFELHMYIICSFVYLKCSVVDKKMINFLNKILINWLHQSEKNFYEVSIIIFQAS